MKNPYNDVKANLQRSERLVAQYSDATKVESAKQEILRRIDEHTLQIVVYGAWNSGKSTLVNALLGEARARVDVIPTTNRIDPYDWDGYRLFDTPGVNAPIEHETITAAQLQRTRAVLLVIREGDQDARDVYDRLFAMMSEKKTVFIVLNHELGSAEEIAAVINRTADIMARWGGQRGIDERSLRAVPIFPVNLNTAWTGRSQKQDKLTEHSGFVSFLDRFYDWTRSLDNETHHLSEVKSMVMNLWYAPASDACARRRETPNGEDLAQLREAERAFAARKNQLHGEASRRTARAIGRVRPEIVDLLRESQGEAQAHDRLKGIMEPVLREMERWLNGEFGIDSTVSATAGTSSALAAGDGGEAPGSTSVDLNPLMDEAQSVAKMVADPKVVKDVLLKLRGTKALGIREVLGLKGKWHTTLGKHAANIARIAKVGMWALQIGMSILDAKRAHDEQEEQNRQKRQAATGFHQAVESVCGDLKSELLSEVDGIIDQAMDALISPLRTKIEDIRRDASEQEERCQLLADYQAQLEMIRF